MPLCMAVHDMARVIAQELYVGERFIGLSARI